MRISSGTAIAGWVSLSWIAAWSGRVRDVAALGQVAAHEVLQRGGDEEVLLAQAQLLAGRRGVARIEHPRDRLGAHPVGQAPTWSPRLKASSSQRVAGLAPTTGAAC